MNPTLRAQILTLKKYQAWRTGKDERTMDDAGIVPSEITSALDAVIAAAENHLRDATKMVEPVRAPIDALNNVLRFNPLRGLGMNPSPSGMYVRYEDLCALLSKYGTNQ